MSAVRRLLGKANVSEGGAILLGRFVACDAHEGGRPVRIVTHSHSDHVYGLRESLGLCEEVLMTPATFSLLSVLRGPLTKDVRIVDYGVPFSYKDEVITLLYADHILGAAQVLVEALDGDRLLYTGDFRLPKTPIIDADVVVMEATYGNPREVRPPLEVVYGELVKLVKEGLREGPIHIYGFHGKVQEAMNVLREAGIDAPFIATPRVFEVTEVYEKHGVRIIDYLSVKNNEAQEILKRRLPYIFFHHSASKREDGPRDLILHLTGWEFRGACWKTGPREYQVALSDHADFNQLIEYISKSRPKLVITDNYRVGNAAILAREIERRLGIAARPLPKLNLQV